jgi:hypothetical protein
LKLFRISDFEFGICNLDRGLVIVVHIFSYAERV